MNTCNQCHKEFEAKRDTARYCSDNCRLAFHRDKVSVSVSVSEPEVSVSKEGVSVSKVSVSRADKNAKDVTLKKRMLADHDHDFWSKVSNDWHKLRLEYQASKSDWLEVMKELRQESGPELSKFKKYKGFTSLSYQQLNGLNLQEKYVTGGASQMSYG